MNTPNDPQDDALDRRVKDGLSHDPGEAYFASFADRVLARIEAAEAARQPAPRPRGGWFGSPRVLAWAGSAAALVVVAGVAWVALQQRSGGSAQLVVGRTAQETRAHDEVPGPSPRVLAQAPAEPERKEVASSPAPVTATRVERADEAARRTGASADRGAAAPPQAAAAPALAKRTPATANELRSRPEVRDATTGEIVPNPAQAQRLQERDQPAATPAPAPAPATESLQDKLLRAKQRAIGSLKSAPPAGVRQEAFSGSAALTSPANPAPLTEESEATARRCGTVRDPQGRPIAGATLVLVETGGVTTSGAQGQFCLDGPARAHTLRVLAVGFHTREFALAEASDPALALALDPVETVAERGVGAAIGSSASSTLAGGSGEAALARALVGRAAQRSARARRDATATSWDAAAGEWTAALAALRTPAAQLDARSRLAEARFEAWRAEPSSERAARWHDARAAFAAAAPADPRLESTPWLKANAIPH